MASTRENDMTNRQAAEQQIAADMNLIGMIEAFGSASAKRAARKQRKAVMAQIKAWNIEDGLADISDADLIAELTA
jgi:hypothetical protein